MKMGRPEITSLPCIILLIDALARFFQTLQNRITTLGLDHIFLETFHTSRCHFSRGVTIIELCHCIGIVQHIVTRLKELVILYA